MIVEGIEFATLVVLAYLLLHEFVWMAWYRIQARRHGCAVPWTQLSPPLGLRNLYQMLTAFRNGRILEDLLVQHFEHMTTGTYMRQVPLDFLIITSHPENVKTVLATNFKDYSLGMRHNQLAPIFGNGIFTLSGEGWKHSRAMLRPQFAREQVGRVGQISAHAAELIRAIERDQAESKFIDIQHHFHLLTMDTATEFLFGESLNTLRSDNSSVEIQIHGERISSEDFVSCYTFLNRYAFRRAIFNKLYWLLDSREMHEKRRKAQVFIDYYVERALRATEPANIGKLDDSVYVFAYELAKVTRDPAVIRDQIFNILIAGRDTTASTLSFSLWYFAQYPEEFAKVRREVLQIFGSADAPVEISFELLKSARYLQYFINEVLRLAPVVPLNFRTAIRDTILPVGGGSDGSKPVFVPKGSSVNYSVFVIHRKPEFWGPDASEFRPERWESHNMPTHPWAYLPFNGGPRICLGQQFALTELALTLVRLLQRFSRIEKAPEFPPEPVLLTSLTLMNGPPGVPIRLS